MEEIEITEFPEPTIESIKKSSEFYKYEEGQCHRNSLELCNGDIMDSLFGQMEYTITNRSIVEGFAIIDGDVFPHIWNYFTICKDNDIRMEYIDITKSLFFNDKSVRYFKMANYDVETLERNNDNGCVFSEETKKMAKQYASDNGLEYKES